MDLVDTARHVGVEVLGLHQQLPKGEHHLVVGHQGGLGIGICPQKLVSWLLLGRALLPFQRRLHALGHGVRGVVEGLHRVPDLLHQLRHLRLPLELAGSFQVTLLRVLGRSLGADELVLRRLRRVLGLFRGPVGFLHGRLGLLRLLRRGHQNPPLGLGLRLERMNLRGQLQLLFLQGLQRFGRLQLLVHQPLNLPLHSFGQLPVLPLLIVVPGLHLVQLGVAGLPCCLGRVVALQGLVRFVLLRLRRFPLLPGLL
mmetsp:Transcript_47511/g.113007  ORF Transcript_47511/g.113007 Transcript_47511/m.113007 type:complete len:255 (+) Transcript_47511:273-1037(+)